MGKRKREDDVVVLDDDVAATPKKKNRPADLYDEVPSAVPDHVDVWLIRKPKSLNLEYLSNLKLPKKIKPENSDITLDTEEGHMRCVFEKPSKSMFYFQTPLEKSDDKKPKVAVDKVIKGIARISCPTTIADPFPQAIEDDFELMDFKKEEVDPEVPFKLKSIRKTPNDTLESKERLVAFGTIETKKRKKSKKEKNRVD